MSILNTENLRNWRAFKNDIERNWSTVNIDGCDNYIEWTHPSNKDELRYISIHNDIMTVGVISLTTDDLNKSATVKLNLIEKIIIGFEFRSMLLVKIREKEIISKKKADEYSRRRQMENMANYKYVCDKILTDTVIEDGNNVN